MDPSKKRFVISLGGSIIVPGAVDVEFLKRFKEVILALVAEGYSFIIMPGGGAVAREYQQALSAFGIQEAEIRDRMGIRALGLNAELLQALFVGVITSPIVTDNAKLPSEDFKVLIAEGAVPGRSSDAGAVELARTLGVQVVINLSNITHVYASDPKENPEAESYPTISWAEYRKLIPQGWDPGLSTPFDPVASEMAESGGLTVAILNGHDTDALEAFVRSGECRGTLIQP